MPLTKLLYCSEHRYDFHEPSSVEQINKIVLVSQKNNLEQSITGVLLADSSSFADTEMLSFQLASAEPLGQPDTDFESVLVLSLSCGGGLRGK